MEETVDNTKLFKGLCGEECVEAIFNGYHLICRKECRGAISPNKAGDVSLLCLGCNNPLRVFKLEKELEAAKTDIASLLWLNGNCEYCKHGQIEKYGNAERWKCKLGNGVDCHAQWRGIEEDEE